MEILAACLARAPLWMGGSQARAGQGWAAFWRGLVRGGLGRLKAVRSRRGHGGAFV